MARDKKQLHVKFMKTKCVLKFGKYAGGSTSIRLEDASSGEPFCTATVSLEHAHPGDGHVFIKDWSENEGVLNALMDAKVITGSLDRYPTGYAAADLCRLLVDPATGFPLEETANQTPVSA